MSAFDTLGFTLVETTQNTQVWHDGAEGGAYRERLFLFLGLWVFFGGGAGAKNKNVYCPNHAKRLLFKMHFCFSKRNQFK